MKPVQPSEAHHSARQVLLVASTEPRMYSASAAPQLALDVSSRVKPVTQLDALVILLCDDVLLLRATRFRVLQYPYKEQQDALKGGVA